MGDFLLVTNAASVTITQTVLNGFNSVSVAGPQSTLKTRVNWLGHSNTLQILNGAFMDLSGSVTQSFHRLLVDGPQSRLLAPFFSAEGGTNFQAIVQGGAEVSSVEWFLFQKDSSLEVRGMGSKFTAVFFNLSGANTALSVLDGGTVYVPRTLFVGSRSTLNVSNGTVNASELRSSSPVSFFGGSLLILSNRSETTSSLEFKKSRFVAQNDLRIGAGSEIHLLDDSIMDVHRFISFAVSPLPMVIDRSVARIGTNSANTFMICSDGSIVTINLLNPATFTSEIRGGELSVHRLLINNRGSFRVGFENEPAVFEILTTNLQRIGAGVVHVGPSGIFKPRGVFPVTSSPIQVTNQGVIEWDNRHRTILPGTVCGTNSLLRFILSGKADQTNFFELKIQSQFDFAGKMAFDLQPGFNPVRSGIYPLINFPEFNVGSILLPFRMYSTDRSRSFRLLKSAGGISAGNYQEDLDGDGVDDQWAVQHFGRTPLTAAELNNDADGDHQSNFEEFFSETDPKNASSFLSILAARKASKTLGLTLPLPQNYIMESSTNLVNWQTEPHQSFLLKSNVIEQFYPRKGTEQFFRLKIQ
jgi:hypothetical protein